MLRDNLLNPDKTILFWIKNLPNKNLTLKDYKHYYKTFKDKKIKWKWKFTYSWIFKPKNLEPSILLKLNFVILQQIKGLYNKKLPI